MKAIKRSLAVAVVSLAMLVGAGATAPSASAAGACVNNNYSYGGYSSCIRYMQTLVNYSVPSSYKLTADGDWGPKTERTVRYFQKKYNLRVDGIVGPRTWQNLCFTDNTWSYNKKRYMSATSSWLNAAKAAGCSKWWSGLYVNGKRY